MIQIGDNFSYLGAKPLDGRISYSTLSAMVGMSASTLYDGCMAYCVETDKNYQWKSANTEDATLGKWREDEGVTIATTSTAGKVKPDDTTITIANDGTISVVDMVGATASTAGTKGLIPSPGAGDNGKYLKGDGTWAELNTLGFTPVGTVISVMGTTAPQNYLACDGTAYNIADYPVLSAYIEEQFGTVNHFGGDGTTTFAVPDLRGEFLRGTGTNSHANQGSGAAVGVHQDATEHVFSATSPANNVLYMYAPNKSSDWDTVKKADAAITVSTGTALYVSANETPSETTGGYMSRPTNTSVLYCIASTNIYVEARFDYSTTEKAIGTWIDGKPLYEKTMYVDVPVTAATGTGASLFYSIGASIDYGQVKIISILNPYDQTSWNSLPVAVSNSSGAITTQIVKNNSSGHPNSLRIINSIVDYSNTKAYVVINYTKTTD